MKFSKIPWAEPIAVSTLPGPDAFLVPADLSPEQKQNLWRHIKSNCPDVKEFLEDETVQEICSRFNGKVALFKEDLGELDGVVE